MNNLIGSKFLFFVVFMVVFSFSDSCMAFYKKKVVIGQFENPVDWNASYHPGKIIADLLTSELKQNEHIQLVAVPIKTGLLHNPNISTRNDNTEPAVHYYEKSAFPEIISINASSMNIASTPHKMRGDIESPWPVEMGDLPKNASMTEIRGKVITFRPDARKESPSQSGSVAMASRENAELMVHVELVQNKTGRILFEREFEAFSSAGKQPFIVNKLNIENNSDKHEPGSMNYALNHLKHEISEYITDKLDSIMLEGEVIAVKTEKKSSSKKSEDVIEEEILLNLGSANGVQIGDLFKVYAIGIGLQDPFTGSDLGDIYARVGVIQILDTWEGFSKAQSLGGNNFKVGYLVQSAKNSVKGQRSSMSNHRTKAEERPWWDFHGIRTEN